MEVPTSIILIYVPKKSRKLSKKAYFYEIFRIFSVRNLKFVKILTTNQLHVSGIRKKISRSFCRISRAQRVKFKETSEIFSEFHKQGVDSYIIPWKVKFDLCCLVSLVSVLNLLQIECSPVFPCFSMLFSKKKLIFFVRNRE